MELTLCARAWKVVRSLIGRRWGGICFGREGDEV